MNDLRIAGVAGLLAGLSAAATLAAASYSFDHGWDLSTGERIKAFRIGDSPEIVSVERSPGYRDLYRQYQLTLPEPELVLVCGTTLIIDVGIPPDWLLKQTWARDWMRHREYCESRVSLLCWDGIFSEHAFFEILERFNPSPEDAALMLAGGIELRRAKAGFEEIDDYWATCRDRYRTDYPAMIGAYFGRPASGETPRTNYDVWRYFINRRSTYPDDLPDRLYEDALENVGKMRNHWVADFFRIEYLRRPTRLNALMAAYSALEADQVKPLFVNCARSGALDRILAEVMPPRLPPLPPPVQKGKAREMNQYYDSEYRDIPRRESFLYFWTCGDRLKSYFRQQIDLRLKSAPLPIPSRDRAETTINKRQKR